SSVCDDCDDADATISPLEVEVCTDGIDNNCDGSIDENCTIDYTDLWTLDRTISYTCAYGYVTINFSQVSVLDNYPSITVLSSGTGSQPGTMIGSFSTSTDFSASRTLTGTCEERYAISGTFTSANSFSATVTATYIPAYGGACVNCINKSWNVTGTR
ncbi:MAG TPA: MopE-related protein, partial [Myxococcota bacterium]|nr:MopE-related protein [Myxococcota bacterium]